MRHDQINRLLAAAVAIGATSLVVSEASALSVTSEEPRSRRKPPVRRAVVGHAEIVEWNRKVEEKRRAKEGAERQVMNINTVEDFDKALPEPYAWPGGYPCYFVTSDGAALSFKAAREQADQIREAIRERSDDGWRVIAVEINYEDPALICDHTGERIESAYAEDEAAKQQGDAG